jgi:hypothetical protein
LKVDGCLMGIGNVPLVEEFEEVECGMWMWIWLIRK